MVKELSYNTVCLVIESWEYIRRVPDYEEKIGALALIRIMDIQPRTKHLFGVAINNRADADDLTKRGIVIHAVRMIRMFEAALEMLGPDTEVLELQLRELGKRHIRYGVSPHFFPFMGQAMMYAFQEVLGKKWNAATEAAWMEIYDEISGEIMKSIFAGAVGPIKGIQSYEPHMVPRNSSHNLTAAGERSSCIITSDAEGESTQMPQGDSKPSLCSESSCSVSNASSSDSNEFLFYDA